MFGKFRQSLALAVLMATGSLFAAAHVDNTWTGNGGDFDLANAKNWKQAWTSDNEIHQMMRSFPSGTYTMSRDLTICAFRFDDKNRAINFDLGSERTLTLTGVDMQPFRFRFGGAGTVFRLTSGTIRHVYDPEKYAYDPVKTENFQYMQLPETSAGYNQTFIVDGPNSRLETRGMTMSGGTNVWLEVRNGGQVVGNVRLSAERTGKDCGIRVSGAASVFEPTEETLDANGIYTLSTFGTAENFTLEFLDGAKPWAGCNGINVGMNGCGACLAYRGANTVMHHAGANLLIGSASLSHANRVEVTDGASLDLGSWRFWLGSHLQSVSNVLYVAGSGSSVVSSNTGSHYVGQRSGGNLVHLADRAKMTLEGSLSVGNSSGTASKAYDNSRNRVIVERGAELECKKNLYIGVGSATNPSYENSATVRAGGRLVVRGAVGIAVNDVNDVADRSFLRAEGEGSRITSESYLRVGRYSGNCGFELFGGAVADFGNYVYLGDNAEVSSGTNHLTVVDSELSLKGQLASFGADDVIAITNGKIRATGNVHLPYFNAAATNLLVTIAGANPVLHSDGDIILRNGAEMRFDVPKTGYSEPAITCGGTLDIRNAMVTFDLDAKSVFPKYGTVIAEATTITCWTSTLRKIREALPMPERYKIKLVTSADKQQLVIDRRGGMSMVIR